MIAHNQRLVGILVAVSLLLLVPLVAMQFTNEVNWTAADFAVAAVLLFGTGFACEFVLRNVQSRTSRLILCGVILTALALVWIELAVGIFGTVFAGS